MSENQPDEAEGEGEEEETEESTVVSGRGQRGVPRRAARRARGRRGGGATRARVVSTRIHGGRRHAALPTTNDHEDNNATLEETVNTESEESPKKPSTTFWCHYITRRGLFSRRGLFTTSICYWCCLWRWWTTEKNTQKYSHRFFDYANLRFVVADATGVVLFRFRPIDRVDKVGSSFSPPVSICS